MQLQLEGCTLHCSALQYYLHSIVCNTLEPKIYNKSLHSATFTRHYQHIRCCAVLRWFQKIDVHKIIQLGAPPSNSAPLCTLLCSSFELFHLGVKLSFAWICIVCTECAGTSFGKSWRVCKVFCTRAFCRMSLPLQD